jgi:hypothetical protein
MEHVEFRTVAGGRPKKVEPVMRGIRAWPPSVTPVRCPPTLLSPGLGAGPAPVQRRGSDVSSIMASSSTSRTEFDVLRDSHKCVFNTSSAPGQPPAGRRRRGADI